MDGKAREDFRQLLLTQPFWVDSRDRKAFLHNLFNGHRMLHSLRIDGAPRTVAAELLDLCEDLEAYTMGGRSPAGALLDAIRREGKTGGALSATLKRLEQAVSGHTATHGKPRWCAPPYPGLNYFDHCDQPIFFGRESETQELIDALTTEQGRNFLIVTGASGSGKSSLVRAGLWARLEQGRVSEIPTSASWLITAMKPSDWEDDPLQALVIGIDPKLAEQGMTGSGGFKPGQAYRAIKSENTGEPGHYRSERFTTLIDSLVANRPGAEWLLILDQMEELFTPTFDQTREGFLELLIDAAKHDRFRVIATVRADFLEHCVLHAGLKGILNNGGQYSVGAPQRLALEYMVNGPIREVELFQRDAHGLEQALALEVDPALAPRIATDAMDQAGGLALMAFALRELYESCINRESTRLSLQAYLDKDFGGLGGAISRRAENVLTDLGVDTEAVLPRLFSPLVYLREQDGVATRKREPISAWSNDPSTLALIEGFTNARLLVKRGVRGETPKVEVAHEALLREWPRLAKWVEDRREALRLRDRVTREAGVWVEEKRPDFRLWKHELLDPARRLLVETDLLEILEQDPDRADFLTPEADWLQAELLCTGTDHSRRETIGMRLSEIGDPRPGVGLVDGVPDILWCPMPAGEVEIEGHGQFRFSAFSIAAYPITYAQYKTFLDADDGYRCGNWWGNLGRVPEPGKQLRPYASYPADNVSWFDATAYCLWLSTKLGRDVRLPDEWEWQCAAQSTECGFTYPWGNVWLDGVANTYEAGIGRTTAVGMYPQGRSVEGVFDLAGNVREWCRNSHDEPKKVSPGSNLSRVLRGGSWFSVQDAARADSRNGTHPHYRYVRVGFRVVCGAPIR